MDEIKIKRRVSAHPLDLGITKMVAGICPDVFETELGDFVIIGRDVTPNVEATIPADAIISNGERVVLIPRSVMISTIENVCSNKEI